MEAVTYIAITPEQFEEALAKSAQIGIKAYKETEAENDVRSVKDWALFLGIDKRTIINKIESKTIIPVSVNPYRISKKEILKMGKK